MAGDKQALKEIDHIVTKLKAFDATVSEDLSDEQFQIILCGFSSILHLQIKPMTWLIQPLKLMILKR